VPGNLGSWDDVRDRLNRLLRDWTGYFSHGTLGLAYRDVEGHGYDRVRNFLKRRHKLPGRGTREFSGTRVFGELGVHRLRRPTSALQP
jgi:RNA-directed DNA polymerase